MIQQDWNGAIQQLLPFRDHDMMRSTAAADRAMLRLGHAYAHLGQWEPSRASMEALVQRFPGSPQVHEARYGIGWAWQNLKQYDNAVTAFTQVVQTFGGELAAKRSSRSGCAASNRRSCPRRSTL